jgi:hypothetical protein
VPAGASTQQGGRAAQPTDASIRADVAQGIIDAFVPPAPSPPPPPSYRASIADVLADAVGRGVDQGISRFESMAAAGRQQAERFSEVVEGLNSALREFKKEETTQAHPRKGST